MGDGRYYTSEQFVNMIWLTTLIIVVVIGLMLCLYKVERFKQWMRGIGVLLGLSLIGRFVAEIAYQQKHIYFFHGLSEAGVVLHGLLCVGFYISYFRNSPKDKRVWLIAITLLCLPTGMLLLNPALKNIAFLLFVVQFMLLSNRFVKYRVSSSMFSDVKLQILDYVFIVGIQGNIIFRSKKVSGAKRFKEIDEIDVNNVEDIFLGHVVSRNAFGNQFIKLVQDGTHYFQYHKKELYNKGKLAGYILTFVDITDLIFMLDELHEKQKEIAAIHTELIKYQEIVYEIEKEKEINHLLGEIANNQQKAMIELKDAMQELDIDDATVTEQMEMLTIKAKADLKNVREAVSAYMNYYEEEGYYD
jgi:hypothetical protein